MDTTAPILPASGPQQTRGSRPGDVRIRRERRVRTSLLDRIASRLRGALPR